MQPRRYQCVLQSGHEVPGFSVDVHRHYNSVLGVALPPISDADLLNSLGKRMPLWPPDPANKDWSSDGWTLSFIRPKSVRSAGYLQITVAAGGACEGAWMERHKFWETRQPAEEYRAHLTTMYPQCPLILVDALAEAAAKALPVRPMPSSIKCSRLSVDGCLLLGDAAHCVTPFLGQGAQSALEDSVILDKAVVKAAGDVAQLCTAYEESRLGDVHALVDLDRLFVFAQPRAPYPVLGKWCRAAVIMSDRLLSLSSILPGGTQWTTFQTELRQGILSYTEVKRRLYARFCIVALAVLGAIAAAFALVLAP